MRVLILGAGPAGLTVAEELRRHDPTRTLDLTMVSSEPYPPYSPPAMADHFANRRDEPLFWKGTDVCDRLRVRYMSGASASWVDLDGRRVHLEDGRALAYERLVVATGSRLYAPIEGNELKGLHDFKSLATAKALIGRVRRTEVSSVIVVGGGFIGVEVALLLADLGLAVVLIQRRWPMARMLDPEMGEVVRKVLVARGVEARLFTPVKGFVGDARVEGVRLDSGEVLRADAYIAATGVKPNIEFLANSGLDVDWGVHVDDRMRASDPNVWAAGDVAETRDRFSHRRYVHANFPNAVTQARVLARAMLGDTTPYPGAESLNSMRHLGLPLIAVGETSEDSVRWRRGEVLRKVYLDQGRIVGFQLSGDIRGAGYLRSLMLKGNRWQLPAARLVDPRFARRHVAALMQPTRAFAAA